VSPAADYGVGGGCAHAKGVSVEERYPNGETTMSKLLRGVAAGYGAKKLGGGCFSTVLIFILLWWLLGNFEIFK
jgi:hypothetical protein